MSVAVGLPNINYTFSAAAPAGAAGAAAAAAAGPIANLQLVYKEDQGQPVGIDTNLAYITQDMLYKRFFADIIKDSQAGTAVPADKIIHLLNACYPTLRAHIPQNIPAYKTTLHAIESMIFQKSNINKHIHEYLNIPKTTTCGNNLNVSYATWVFWESGYGPIVLCSLLAMINTILTPASKLDPLGKGDSTMYWPEDNISLTFIEEFCRSLGFPSTVWKKNGTEITIKYKDKDEISAEIKKSTTLAELQADQSKFGPYLKGNSEKNKIISTLKHDNEADCGKFRRLAVTKELGDVAQVWLYFAFVVLRCNKLAKAPGSQDCIRSDAVMLTTDSVVYLLCVILNLACVYSGSKHGWMPHTNSCTLYSYIPGEIDYKQKFTTMLNIVFERIMNHNSNTALILLSAICTDLSILFYYYRTTRGGIALSNDYRKVGDNQKRMINSKDAIKTSIKTYIKELEHNTNEAQKIYDSYLKPLMKSKKDKDSNEDKDSNKDQDSNKDDTPIDELYIDTNYNAFLVQINEYFPVPVVTRINNKRVILIPETPLATIIAQHIKMVGLLIVDVQNVTTLPIEVLGTESDNIGQAGGAFMLQDPGQSIESYNDYITCEMLCYTYYMLHSDNNMAIHNIINKQITINHDIMTDYFPLLYDYYVSLIPFDGNSTFLSFLYRLSPVLTEDHIKEFGTQLAEYVPFQEHYTKAENKKIHKFKVNVNSGAAIANNGAAAASNAQQQAVEEAALERAARERAARHRAAASSARHRAAEEAALERAALERAALEQAAEEAARERAALERAAEEAARERAALERAARKRAADHQLFNQYVDAPAAPAALDAPAALAAPAAPAAPAAVLLQKRQQGFFNSGNQGNQERGKFRRITTDAATVAAPVAVALPAAAAAPVPSINYIMNGSSRRRHKKLNNIKSKKQRKLRNRNAAIRPPKTRSAPRRLRRVLRRSHATRKAAARTRY